MKIRPILIFSHIFFENSLQFQKLYLPLQPQTRKIGAIAQLVEQRTENPCVPGSIPGGTTQINTPIEMIIFQWEYLFTPTPPIPSNML